MRARPEVIRSHVTQREVAMEAAARWGHPVVYYDMGEENFVECLYCDRRFVLACSAADTITRSRCHYTIRSSVERHWMAI